MFLIITFQFNCRPYLKDPLILLCCSQVFDIHKLATEIKVVERLKYVEQVKVEATAKAISEVKNRIRAQLEAEALERRRGEQINMF